ncbi:branched-chain amino acid ABC transporter permease [Candidatus Woesearchaeota archaeon]|nr:branched-chain amino acid ABC transporter permease [Candidatus Woesearchaeota archaeon]
MAFINYLIHLAILIGIYSLLTVSLNFAIGFTGLLNLGHVGFFGIGAYTSALLSLAGIPLWLSIPAGIIMASLCGILLSIPTMRLKGDYLALATLGFTFILGSIARNWTDLTRGALGLPGIPRVASNNTEFLVFVAVVALLTYAFFHYFTRTRFGKICQAVRDDELATKMLGHNTMRVKMAALGTSAAFAGLGGALFSHYITFIDPTIFGLADLILLFSMMIVGGLGSVKGAAVGTAILLLLPEPLRFIGFPSSVIGPAREIIFSLLLLLILIYRPKGIFGEVDLG